MLSRPKPLILLVLDGFGYSRDAKYNAGARVRTPCLLSVTADHGNIEHMRDNASGHQAHTAHTTNQVPLVYVGGDRPLMDGGSLSDLAPTLLAILGIEQPVEMTGKSRVKSA